MVGKSRPIFLSVGKSFGGTQALGGSKIDVVTCDTDTSSYKLNK